ncbi:MAG: hypothetical protein HY827_02900 [Actinobacteria bacterium]|nr:hypothetical protein [Actinomycetota bacterium]
MTDNRLGINGFAVAAFFAVLLSFASFVAMLAASSPALADTAPVVTINPFLSNITASSRPVFTFGAVSANPVTFTCSLDGAAFLPCEAPWTAPVDLADGSHSLNVIASDGVNQGFAPGYGFYVDTVPPVVTIVEPHAAEVYIDPIPTLNFSVDGGTASCSYDASPFVRCDEKFTGTSLANGSHRLCVRAVDPAGNTTQRCVDFEIMADESFSALSAPDGLRLTVGRTGRVKGGKFKTRLGLRVTPSRGAGTTAACSGRVGFYLRPKVKRARGVRARAKLRRSGRDCLAVAKLALPVRYQGAGATVRVKFAGNDRLEDFDHTIAVKAL